MTGDRLHTTGIDADRCLTANPDIIYRWAIIDHLSTVLLKLSIFFKLWSISHSKGRYFIKNFASKDAHSLLLAMNI